MRVTSCNGDAVTSRSPVLDPRKKETLDVDTSKKKSPHIWTIQEVYATEPICGEGKLRLRNLTWTRQSCDLHLWFLKHFFGRRGVKGD